MKYFTQWTPDWDHVARDLIERTEPGCTVFYQKHMAHHMQWQNNLDWLHHATHVFLIRDPSQMIPSLHEKLATFDLAATGLPFQVRLHVRI